MAFDFFLAQTAGDIRQPLPLGAAKAWMACHFSPYSSGLSNLPEGLEEGSMVILNDLMPVAAHDAHRIAAQLCEVVENCQCCRVLLDFQRPGEGRTAEIAKVLAEALPCPVGVSESYAQELDCPVFLPPLPLHMPLADYIAPWQGRRVWLEIMPEAALYTVTEDGCRRAECEAQGALPHFDKDAFCRYGIDIAGDAIRFTLQRGPEELEALRQSDLLDCFVGLYQDFAQSHCRDA